MVRLFSLFYPQKLTPVWEFSSGALLWRIFFAPMNRIIGETRDQEKKSASFFCLDAYSGNAIWKDMVLDELWWVGIEAVHRDVLICHGFARPDMPEHKGLRAIDSESGQLLWKNDDLSFWFGHENRIYAQKYLFEKRIAFALDLHTGAVVEEYADNLENLYALKQSMPVEGDDDGPVFPDPFNSEVVDPAVAAQVTRIARRKKGIHSIEYLLHRGLLFVSFYQTEQSVDGTASMSNILAIIDMSKQKILQYEILARDAVAPAPDTFFVKKDFLYFIKNRRTLTALMPWML